jgi:hypothetical protein
MQFFFFFFFGNAQIMGHMEKFDLTKCINIKTSIMDDANFKIIYSFHFLKMHKLCHAIICN